MTTRLTLLAGLFVGLIASTVNARVNSTQIRWTGTDAEFISSLYQGVLQRNPDPRGFQHWMGLVRSNRTNRLDMFKYFSSCPEYVGKNRNAWRERQYNVCYHIYDRKQWVVTKNADARWIPYNTGRLEFGVAMAFRDYYSLIARGVLDRFGRPVYQPVRTSSNNWRTPSRPTIVRIPAPVPYVPRSTVTSRPNTVTRYGSTHGSSNRSSSINLLNNQASRVSTPSGGYSCTAAGRPRY